MAATRSCWRRSTSADRGCSSPRADGQRPFLIGRRAVLAGIGIGLATSPPSQATQPGLETAAQGLRPALVAGASAALWQHRASLWSRDVVALVDFALPSSVPRLFLLDLLRGTRAALLVTHGKGSDPEHDGRAKIFSNVEGSLASSVGAYLTGPAYVGVHGPSRRLIGLDPSDDRAEARAIVIHAAWYAGADVLARQGVLGRSDGCFAVGPADLPMLMTQLGEGRLLFAAGI